MTSKMASEEQIKQSYLALKEYFSPLKRHQSSGNPAQLIVFAEHAVKNGCKEIALDCTKLYFSLNPPVNQFHVRAHFCEALASAPSHPSLEEQLAHSLCCILKAVAIARKSECYHFLLYNASILLWQICRPFQCPGSRKNYVKPLSVVLKALDDIKEKDIPWRLELMTGLVLSQLDAGQSEEAVKTCTSAIKLARKKAPEKFRELMRIYVSYNLGDSKSFDKDCKSHPEYGALIRLYKIKSAIVLQKLSGTELEQKLYKLLRFIKVGTDHPSSGRRTALSTTPTPPLEEKPLLLLELGSLAFECGLKQLAEECLSELPQDMVGQPVQWCVRKQVLNCQLKLKEGYSKAAVEGRVQAVNRLEDILTSALRTNDMDLVQHVCIVLWNTSLPLLQSNLRHHLRKPLTATATVLEQINSLLLQMRIGIHFELGKIYADQGHLEASLENLDKAYNLDCFDEYREQISVVQNKVSLRAQLYTTPEEPLHRAIKIIEQANSSTGGDELGSLLAKAGDLLAPGQFSQTLSKPSTVSGQSVVSQVNPTSEPSGDTRDAVEDKGKKLARHNMSKELVREHLKNMSKIEDRQRCHVWSDLARAARKQGIWDVAASAARFCVAYDDGRWSGSVTKPKLSLSERLSSPRFAQRGNLLHQNSSFLLQTCDSQLANPNGRRVSLEDVSRVSSLEAVRREECDLVRTLANTHCLLAECLVFYLQQEGLELGEKPPPLNVSSLTEDWSSYQTWCSQLSSESIAGFLRAGELGTALGEEVVVENAAVYLWNYHLHWVKSGQLTEVVGAFKPLLASMKQIKMSSDSVLLTRVSAALVDGLVQKWSPKGTERPRTAKKGSRADSRGPKKNKTAGLGDDQVQVDPESGAELKEAFEVCEYCASVWSSSVPMSARGGLLSGWVACRQLLRQPFTSNKFGIDETDDPFAAHCRVMIAAKVLSVQGNRIWDFPNSPSLSEVAGMVSECDWSDVLVEMELWVRLAELALKQKDPSMAYQCTCKAVALKLPKPTSDKLSSDQKLGCELQSLGYSLQGQTLSTSAASNVSVVRKALEAFHNAVRSGHRASSYSLVFDGCRHYWQTCCPLTTDPLERDYLQEPLSELLELSVSFLGGRHGAKNQDQLLANKQKDYEVVSQMYGTVFQAYIDKCRWEEGLTLVEEALWSTPKPIHPHLVPYKLVFKSRMGKNVESDFIRFQDEPNDFIASLWYKTATNSSDPTQTITAYQKAIDTLQDGDGWQKIEYLLEFCEWLYTHHFPITDPIDQLEKVTEILLSTCDEEKSSSIVGGVRQLEVLIRVHVMMALLYGRGSSEHKHLCVVTVGLCTELWKMLLGGANTLPTSVLEWSTYSPPSQLLEQLSIATGDKALNKDNLPQPMLVLHYLSELIEALFFSGLHTLAFPVIHLQMVIAQTLVVQNKPLCQLYRMRLLWLCSEFGLSITHKPHSLPDPEDLASSQIEIKQYQAKKAAVEKGSKNRTNSKPKTTLTGLSVGVQRRCVEEKVFLREIWVDMAKLLIQQGEYQLARDLLNQALLSSQTFEDERTLYIIHVLSARLALVECDQQRAIKLVTQAQKYPTDLDDWLEGILLLSDAINSSSDYKQQLKPVLKHAMSKLNQLLSSEKNNSSRLRYAIEAINTRLALCELGDSIQEDSVSEDSIRALSDQLTDSARILMDLGYSRDAAHINTQHAFLLRSYAHSKVVDIEDQFQTWMLDAISLCAKAVNALQSIYEHAQTVYQLSEDICPPVQRELIGAQCMLAHLLLDAFSRHSAQCRQAKSKTKDKSSVEKLIEDFVKEEPVLSLVQKEWQSTIQMALEKALTLLTSAHSMANTDNILKTKVMVGLGCCFHLLSTHTRPDSALQWAPEYCVVKTEGPIVSDEEYSPEPEEKSHETLSGVKYGALSSVMRKKEAKEAECDENASLLYLSQATHMLVQAVSMCLRHSQLTLGAQTALEIVDCCGGFDSTTSSLYLALYQSLSVSMEMEALVRQVLADPSFSKLGALLEQKSHLLSSQSPSQHNIQELKTFEAYKMLTVSENHLDLLKQFPHHFRFIMLQHSPDRSRLYASYLVSPQPPPSAPKKGQPPSVAEVLDPVVTCANVNSEDLNGLLDMMNDFKSSHYQCLTKPNPAQNDSEGLLKDVIAGTEAYLSKVMPIMVKAISREKSDKELTIVVLADTLLLQLPLEALEIFHAKNIQSVARDFSLQILYHRLEKFAMDESVPATESSKDTKKKVDKYQALPTTLLANTANFRYILDPRKEIEEVNICSEIIRQIQQFSKLTSKWSGYNSGEQVMSISKWVSLLKESSGLILFTPENLLAHLPPTNLIPLTLQDCALAVVMDRAHTTKSILLQSKLDFHKSCFELRCEHPVETAILLSLVGVRSLLSNQWTNSVQNNLDKVVSVVKGLLSEGLTVGKLNWSSIQSLLSGSEGDIDENIAQQSKTNLVEGVENNESKKQEDDENIQDKEPVKYSRLYNSVVYGLPHINLIASST